MLPTCEWKNPFPLGRKGKDCDAVKSETTRCTLRKKETNYPFFPIHTLLIQLSKAIKNESIQYVLHQVIGIWLGYHFGLVNR